MVGYGSQSETQCTYRSTYLHHLTACERPEPTLTNLAEGLSTLEKSSLFHTQTLRRFVLLTLRRGAKSSRLALCVWTLKAIRKTMTTSIPPVLGKYLYSVPEAARLLSCSRSTLYELMKTGKVLAVYPNSSARIPASSLDSYVNNLVSHSHASRHQRQRSVQ